MGTWSAKIMGNDTSCEVNEYFKRMYLYQEGNKFKWTEEEIADSLLTYYYDMINSHDSIKCDFFFGLAESLWQVGKKNVELISIIDNLINTGQDINAAKSLDATEKYLSERKTHTHSFQEKIKKDNPKPKKRELKPGKLSVYTYGDCLVILYMGMYYGLIVVDDARNTDDGTNQFAFTSVRQIKKPILADFAKAFYPFTADVAAAVSGNPGDASLDILFAFKMNKSAVLKEITLIEKIGRLPLTRSFYERQCVRVTDFPSKIPSLIKLVEKSAQLWRKKDWRISDYSVDSAIVPCLFTVTGKNIQFGKRKVKFSDVFVHIDNSIWHINVSVYVAGISIPELENYWFVFSEIIAAKTGREVNQFYLKNERDNGMISFNKIDFLNYKLKHVRDYKII